MIVLGMINTRLKDYYDLWKIGRTMNTPAQELVKAVIATFARRGTPLPEGVPPALSEVFCQDAQKRTMWNAFLDRNDLDAGEESFDSVVAYLRSYLMPVLDAARRRAQS